MTDMTRGKKGNIFAMLFGGVALVGVLGVSVSNLVIGPVTTTSRVTQHNIAQNDLMMNAKVVVMNASTREDMGDEDNDGYVEPVPFIPTSDTACALTLPAGGQGGCLPSDIGAILTDPWGSQYAYCVWDHGTTNISTNRIQGEDSTSGAVLAILSAGPNKRLETPCLPYDGDPETNDDVINTNGIGDDLVQIYTYAAAVAGSGGLWELKQNEPTTAIIDKKLEIGDVSSGTGFAFDTATGQGEFPYIKTDYIASKTGGTTPVTMDSNIALDGNWLSGDGGNEGVFVDNQGRVGIGTSSPSGVLTIKHDPALGDSGNDINIYTYNDVHTNGILGYTANGSVNTPESVKSGRTLMTMYGRGYDGTGFRTAGGIFITAQNDFDVSVDGSIDFRTALNDLVYTRMYISSEGHIGIGTREPERVLHILGSGGISDDLIVESVNNDNASGGIISFFRARGTVAAKEQPLKNDFLGSFSTRGWNSQTETYDEAGVIHVRASEDWDISRSADMRFATRHNGVSAERMRITSNGNIGFGYSTPNAVISFGDTHSNAADCADEPNGYLRDNGLCRNDVINIYEHGDDRYGFGIHSGTLEIYSWADTEIGRRLADGTFTPFMHINRNGKIGIATTEIPTDALQVNGDIRLGIVTANATGNAYGNRLHFSGGTGFPDTGRNSDNTDVLWMARYNVASDQSELRVNIGDNYPSNGDAFVIGSTAGSGIWNVLLRVGAGGYVGIGTDAPTHPLHVNGVARSTQANFATSSDLRVKEDIAPLADGLDTVMQLRPVSYHYKPDYIEGKQGMDGLKRGFIAHEVEAIVPEMVTQTAEAIGEGHIVDDFRILNNSDFIPILVKAMQELKAENDILKARLDLLEAASKE